MANLLTTVPGAITLGEDGRSCVIGEARAQLTDAEFRVLKALASKPSTTVSRTELTYALYVGKDATAESNVLEVMVSRLRRKIAALGAKGIIETARGLGYRFVGEVTNVPAQ